MVVHPPIPQRTSKQLTPFQEKYLKKALEEEKLPWFLGRGREIRNRVSALSAKYKLVCEEIAELEAEKKRLKETVEGGKLSDFKRWKLSESIVEKNKELNKAVLLKEQLEEKLNKYGALERKTFGAEAARIAKIAAGEIMEENGIKVSWWNLSKGMWMLQHGIPITKENMLRSKRDLLAWKREWAEHAKKISEPKALTNNIKKDGRLKWILHPRGWLGYFKEYETEDRKKILKLFAFSNKDGFAVRFDGSWEYVQQVERLRVEFEEQMRVTEKGLIEDANRVLEQMRSGEKEPKIPARLEPK